MAGEVTPPQKPAIDPADYDIDASRTDLKVSGETPEKPPRERAADGTFLPTEEPAAPVSKHPGYLIEFAKDFGFTDAEIESLSPEALGRSVQILRQRDAARQRQLQAEYQLASQRVVVPPPAPAAPAADPEIDLGVDESEFSPDLMKLAKKIRLDSMKENLALKNELKTLKDQQAQVQQTANANHLDAAFDALGDGYEHIFGAGQGTILEQENPDAIDRRIQAIKAVARQHKINPFAVNPKTLAAKIKQHADELYQVKAKPPAPADPYAGKGIPAPSNGKGKARITEEEWSQAGLAKPTARSGAGEPDGELKAIRNLESKMKEQGTLGSIPNQSELEGFL